MKRVGIGGVLIMEVDQGAPQGKVPFAGPRWRKLFQHVCAEANRLGLEVNMNNDAGWCGSGGPWVPPGLAMQRLVWTETQVEGPRSFEGQLRQPQAVAGFYRDVAVLAFPSPARASRIVGIRRKSFHSAMHTSLAGRATWPADPEGSTVPRGRILDLTKKMDAGGQLVWDIPGGRWTILRIGHTPTGKDNHPAPESGRGLECDKLSRRAVETHFAGFMGKLIRDVGPLAGKTLVATHIDSWEVGVQNWTPTFRDEFRRRRGYDPLPWLPVVAGRVVGSREQSERFLWDLRQTVGELLLENYAGHMRQLAQRHGLRLSIEAYTACPVNELQYAGRADEPMGEFWSWRKYGAAFSCTEMASAAHVYGKPIVGAEAFTATNEEAWQGHPGNIKDLGDWAFCEGINRFVFHRYALQPWRDRRPGMSMGPWGLHYERTQTWWELSKAWHEYLARCQFLLQQGRFVADICLLTPEGAPQSIRGQRGFQGKRPDLPLERPGHNFDLCPPELVLREMTVRDGRLVLPSGMSYRLLALP
ncbi:MAG TPA: glycosyl hydrolase, partial [Planctomycetaceae bacterium]|nr:glycosyl hydrolase [Planctomycetaceae bacterium]